MKKIYICVGEQYKNNVRMFLCGGKGTIPDILKWLYGEKAESYFCDWTDKEVIKYIQNNAGKRLEEVKGISAGWWIV